VIGAKSLSARSRAVSSSAWTTGPDDSPEHLRAFRLAETTLDTSARDALTLYGQELLARAEAIERAGRNP
jgi:hypothetical protein